MALREEMERQGSFLFRWRSCIPILALPLFVIALRRSEYLEKTFGDSAENIWEAFCVFASLLGLSIRCVVAGYVPKGTSGRNARQQTAQRLNTRGMYSLVRNPLYLGNLVIYAGVLLFTQSWWLVLIGIAGFLFYYERIIFTEEEFLREKFDGEFLEWAKKTPLWIPRFRNWRKPELPFSWKTVLRREHSTFYAIIASYTFLGIFSDLLSENKLEISPAWIVIFGLGLGIYLALRFLKKKTKLLNVQGR